MSLLQNFCIEAVHKFLINKRTSLHQIKVHVDVQRAITTVEQSIPIQDVRLKAEEAFGLETVASLHLTGAVNWTKFAHWTMAPNLLL